MLAWEGGSHKILRQTIQFFSFKIQKSWDTLECSALSWTITQRQIWDQYLRTRLTWSYQNILSTSRYRPPGRRRDCRRPRRRPRRWRASPRGCCCSAWAWPSSQFCTDQEQLCRQCLEAPCQPCNKQHFSSSWDRLHVYCRHNLFMLEIFWMSFHELASPCCTKHHRTTCCYIGWARHDRAGVLKHICMQMSRCLLNSI